MTLEPLGRQYGCREFALAMAAIAALAMPLVTGMMAAFVVLVQGAQNPATLPKCEAVSIRRCGTGSVIEGQRGEAPGPFTFTPDRMILRCVNVKSLIESVRACLGSGVLVE